jgi:hypothetical protein
VFLKDYTDVNREENNHGHFRGDHREKERQGILG